MWKDRGDIMAYTINANAKNVWIRDNENTRDLSIQTDASSVYLDNGRTLEHELGEGSMVSNVATVDSAMSKVIDGTLDGVYESGVMYGRSLVNLSNLHKSFNDVTLSDYYFDTSLCETSKLKLGTPYTLVFYTTVHGGDHDIYSAFELGVGNELHGTNAHPKTTTNHWGTLVKNGWSKVCVTFTDFLGYKYLSLRPIRCHAPESGKSIRFSIEGFILLEGDWSNKDLPFNDYFTGLCDVKMPILRNVGKNLFYGQLKLANFASDTANEVSSNSHVMSVDFIRIKPSTQYYFSCGDGFNSTAGKCILWYDKNKVFINHVNEKGVSPSNAHYCRLRTRKDDSTVISESEFDSVKMQLEESSTATTYEDYKTNILRTPDTVTLRSLPNGVRDELNLKTGEYVQRIGEIVFDGSEGWAYHSTGTVNGTTAYRYRTNVSNMLITNQLGETPRIFCDKLPCVRDTQEEIWSTVPNILRRIAPDYGAIYIVASTSTVDAFKQWLSQNPITVQYELAEPITTIVEPLTIPFAYENGHIILESGSEEQSLLPTLEYSTVVNRTGQVESVAKTIQTQEKQLTMLEQMLIQNIIGLDYNNTVLALNLEINEVM